MTDIVDRDKKCLQEERKVYRRLCHKKGEKQTQIEGSAKGIICKNAESFDVRCKEWTQNAHGKLVNFS